MKFSDQLLADLREGQTLYSDLREETVEAQRQRKTFDADVSAVLNHQITDARQHAQQTQANSQQTGEILERIASGAERMAELKAMPFAEELLPVMSLFGENYNPRAISARMDADRAHLQVLSNKQKLSDDALRAKDKQRASELKLSQHRLSIEQGDVTDVVTQIQLNKETQAFLRDWRTEFVRGASADELDEAVKDGRISAEEAKTVLQTRRGRSMALEAQALNLQGAKENALERRLNNMTDAEIANARASGAISARREQIEMQRRQHNRIAATMNEMRFRATELQTVNDADIKAGVGTKWTQKQADDETRRRQVQIMSHSSYLQAQAAKDAQQSETAKETYLGQMGYSELQNAVKLAEENDGIAQVNGMPFRIDQLQRQMQVVGESMGEGAMFRALESSNQTVIQQAGPTMALTAGIDVPTNATTADVAAHLAQSKNVPAAMRTIYAQAAAVLKEVDTNTDIDTLGRQQLQTKAMELITTAQQQAQELRAASTPREQQPALQELFNYNGQVQSQRAASDAIISHVGGNELTGSPFYDAALTTYRDLVTRANKDKSVETLRGLKDDPKLLFQQVLQNPEAIKAAQKAAMGQVVGQALKNTAQHEEFAETFGVMLEDPGSVIYEDGKLSLGNVFEYFESQEGGKTQAMLFSQLMRREMVRQGQAATAPTGHFNHVQASVNRAMFGNNAMGIIASYGDVILSQSRKIGQRRLRQYQLDTTNRANILQGETLRTLGDPLSGNDRLGPIRIPTPLGQ